MRVEGRQLRIVYDNAAQYLTADNCAVGVKSYGTGVVIKSTAKSGYAILNDAAKAVLFPNAVAKPVKADSRIACGASVKNKNNYCSLEINGTEVHKVLCADEVGEQDGLTSAAITSATSAATIRYHLHIDNLFVAAACSVGQLTLYFKRYSCSAIASGNGVMSASVSETEPWDGQNVNFSANLVQGATWVGWYSDAACTNLVSTDQNYSVSPTSDLTLYAKATHDAELFTCAAVAGANISSVNISDSTVPANGSCTFSAMANAGCAFEGWYSDESCTNLVSTENPYTATIIANTTLYAKAHIINFNISVEQSEYGSADVNTSIAQYGDNVTFIATPSSQRYDFLGWYADAAYTNLVSLDNPYNCTVTTDIKLYPKFGLKNYNLIVHPTGYDKINFNGVTNIENVEILYKNSSKETSTDTVAIWAIGELNKSDNPASVGFFVDGAKFSSIPTNATITNINVSMKVKADGNTGASITSNTSRGFYTAKKEINGDSFSYAQIGTTKYKDVVIKLNEDSEYSYYLTYTISNEEAGKWTAADLKSGSFGIVWLVSSPSLVNNGGVCKHLIHNIDISVSYTLPEGYITSTALYFKANGSYKSATKVYKKVSGTWVEQADLPAIFSGEPSGGASNYVYGGSV
jgi:hypothetical protein